MTAEEQHTASLKSFACFLFLFSPARLRLLILLLDERYRSSQPWPHLFFLCVRWKRDLAGQVSAMLHLLQMGPSKAVVLKLWYAYHYWYARAFLVVREDIYQ